MLKGNRGKMKTKKKKKKKNELCNLVISQHAHPTRTSQYHNENFLRNSTALEIIEPVGTNQHRNYIKRIKKYKMQQ